MYTESPINRCSILQNRHSSLVLLTEKMIISLVTFLAVSTIVQGKPLQNGTLTKPQWNGIYDAIFADEIEPRPVGSYYGVKKYSCGTHNLLSGDRGLIQSPEFSFENYPDSYHCEWNFETEDSCILNVRCLSVNIVESPNCSRDYLEIDNTEEYHETFCGDHVPQGFVASQTGALKIRFHSDSDHDNDLGFACVVSCKPLPSEEVGTPQPLMNCKCGKSQTGNRIVGGVESNPNSYPWMASLVYRKGVRPFCGASLINNQYVLTAAHCIDTLLDPLEVRVVLKKHNFTNKDDEPRFRLDIAEVIAHPDYSRTRNDYDIALLKLEEPLDEYLFYGEDSLGTICLPARESSRYAFEGALARVIGWGTVSEGGKLSPVLREVDVEVIPQDKCNIQMSNKITSRMLCAGYDDGKRDSCQGDSGGPLVIKDEATDSFTQIGVVSWGWGCAREEKPGIYARMTEFLDWIEENTRGSLWCSP